MPKTKKCRKLAPFVCPKCKRTDCYIDHWDAPMAEFSLCSICGESGCRKNTTAAHRKRCKRVADHRGKCKT